MNQFFNTLSTVLILLSGQIFGTTLYAAVLINSPLPLPCDTSPVVIYTLDSTICIGETTTLYAPSGNQSYLWNNGSTTSSIQVAAPGLYSVIVIDAGGCTHSSNQINVQVFQQPPKPQIGFEGPQGICGGTSPARLVTSAQGQFLWMNNAITSFTDVSYPTIAWVEVTDFNGCVRRSDSIQVDTIRRVTASLSYWYPGIPLCETDSIQIEVLTNNFPYTFQWANGNTGNKSYVVPESYLESVTVIGDNGCRKTLTPNILPITVNFELQNWYDDPPIVYYTCPNVPYLITISPDPGHTYEWSDGDNTTVNKPLNGSPNGTPYTLKVTWNNFCSRYEDIIVKTYPESAIIRSSLDTVCSGQSYVSMYTSLYNPVWSTGATSNNTQVLPTVTTTYTVSGTDIVGCARTLSKKVNVKPLPTFTITGLNTPVCLGDSLFLTASGAASYTWGHGSNAVQGPVFHKPTNQFSSKIYVTGANGCTKDSNLVPNIDFSARFDFNFKEYFVCTGDSILLDPKVGAGSYNWSNGSTDTAITIIADTTKYSCTYTSPSGCSFTRITNFYTYEDSVPIDTINIDYLPGDSVYIGGSLGSFSNYLWSTGDTVPLLKVHPLNQIETYTQYAYKDSGCTLVWVYVLHKDTLPKPYIIRPDTICAGDSALLTLSEPGTYLWQVVGSDTTQSKMFKINYPYTIASVYYKRINGNTRYLIRDTIRPTSYYPYGSIVGPDSVCEGIVVDLSFNNPGYKFLWNTGDTTRKISVSPPSFTTYSLLVENNGCSKTLNYPLHIFQRPPPPLLSGDTILCAGNSTTLSANSPYPILWNINSALPSIHVSPDVDKTYTVFCIDQNQCHSDTSSITVYVGSSSISYIEGVSEICRGQSTNLIATGFESCTWSTGDSLLNITVTPQVSTIYSVSGLDASGCSATRSFNLNVKDPPQQGQCLICQTGVYCDSGRVIVSFNYLGFDSLVWSTGSTDLGIYVNPVVPTWYYLDGYSSCYSAPIRDSIYVTPRGYFNARIEGDTMVCPGAVVGLNVQLSVPGTFLWSNGSTSQTTYVTPATTTTYLLTITGANGCTETLYHTIYVVNSFTDSIVGDKNLCADDTSALLKCTNISGASYLWSNGSLDNVSTYNIFNSVHPIEVLITLNGGCSTLVKDTIIKHSNPLIPAISGPSQLCEGDSATLVVSGGLQYQWTSGASGSLPSIWVSPAVSTTYSANVIYYSDGFTECKNQVTDSIIVINKPLITVSGAANSVCPGTNVSLVASGANSFSWNNTIFNNTISFVATQDTVLLLKGFGGCGFVDSILVPVNVFQSLNDTVYSDTSICFGAIATITSTINGMSYLWQNGSTLSHFSFKCESDTAFYCLVNISGGCSTILAIRVDAIYPNPVSISGNTSVCNGESTQLSGEGAVSYIWEYLYPGKYFQVFPTKDTIISIIGTDANGCTDTASVTIDLLPSFDFMISGNSVVCSPNQTFVVDFLNPFYYSTTGYTFAWSTGSTYSSTNSINVNSPEVSVTVTNNFGCSFTKSKSVMVLDNDDLLKDDSLLICSGQSTVLSVENPSQYTSFNWGSGWTTNQNLNIFVTSDTLITLQAKTSINCILYDTIFIDVKSQVNLSISGSQSVCTGSICTWSANTNAPIIQWFFPGQQYFMGDSVSFMPTVAGLVTIIATDTSGCSVSETRYLGLVTNSININDSTFLCLGDTAQLTVNGGVSWNWSTGETTNTISVNPSNDTIYTVLVNTPGCSGTYKFNVFVSDSLNVAIFGDTATCINEPANFFVNVGSSWQWSNGLTSSAITLPAGTMDGPVFVTVKFYDGCYGYGSIFHYNYPSTPLQIFGDTIICSGTSTILSATPGYANYHWNTGAITPNIVIPPGQSGTYGLSATDYAGCTFSDSLNVGFTTQPGFLLPNSSIYNCALNEGLLISKLINSQDSIQWQYSSVINGVYSNLVDGVQVNGVHSDSLKILDVNFFNGKFFRCKLFSDCFTGQTISDTIRFDIIQQVDTVQSATICENEWFYVGFTAYNQTGNYVDTLLSQFGCDSIITTLLTVNPIQINTNVIASDTQLVAANGYIYYQWYNCITGAPIPGANSSIYNAPSNSFVSLVISDGVCTDTTSCIYVGFTGINDDLQHGIVQIIPNPFSENLTISLSDQSPGLTKISMYNNLGQLVISKWMNDNSIVIRGEFLQAGLYYLRVESGNKISHFKVIKTD